MLGSDLLISHSQTYDTFWGTDTVPSMVQPEIKKKNN
jgi:hypothetical protein